MPPVTSKYSLLRKVVLPGAASLAVGERALAILFTSVDPCITGQVTTGSENSIAGGADMFLLGDRVLDDGDYLLRSGPRRLWGNRTEDCCSIRCGHHQSRYANRVRASHIVRTRFTLG